MPTSPMSVPVHLSPEKIRSVDWNPFALIFEMTIHLGKVEDMVIEGVRNPINHWQPLL
jgi:hypothetical protein